MSRERVYLDANIFILAMETRGALSYQLAELFAGVSDVPPTLVTSELTLAELLVGPVKSRDRRIIAAYEFMIGSNDRIETRVVTRDILRASAWLRAVFGGLKLPDAIHLATAASARCTKFLSADRDMPRRLGMSAIELSDGQPSASWLEDLAKLETIRPEQAAIAELLQSNDHG